jgi:hypothetical protein
MVNNNTNLERCRLNIKSQPSNPIKKQFSKTHALMFGIGMLEKF